MGRIAPGIALALVALAIGLLALRADDARGTRAVRGAASPARGDDGDRAAALEATGRRERSHRDARPAAEVGAASPEPVAPSAPSSPPEPAATAAAPGGVAGHAFAGGGRAAVGAIVTARAPDGSWPAHLERPWSVVADDGSFDVEPLLAGTWVVRAELNGLVASATVAVAPGETTEGVVLQLPPSAAIEVTVLDASGEPRGATKVTLLDGDGRDTGHSARTDELGVARLEPLRPGAYTAAAGMRAEGDPEIVTVLTGAVRARADRVARITLRPDGAGSVALHGTVSAAGAPVAGEMLVFFRDGHELLGNARMARTDDAGGYEIVLPGPGWYAVTGPGPDRIDLGLVQVPARRRARRDLEWPSGSLAGRVEGAAVEGVALERADGLLAAPIPDLAERAASVRGGRFRFDEVPPGAWVVRAAHGGVGHTGPVEIAAGESVEGVVLRARPAGRAVVRVDGGGGARVVAVDADGRTAARAVADADGDAVLRLAPGGYALRAFGAQGASRPSPLTVPASGEGSAHLRLEPGGLLEVRCLGPGGVRPACAVELLDDSGSVVRGARAEVDATFTKALALTTHVFGPLPPGRYVVRARAVSGETGSTGVDVEAGGSTSVGLAVE